MRKKKQPVEFKQDMADLDRLRDIAIKEVADAEAKRIYFDKTDYYKLIFLSESAKRLSVIMELENYKSRLSEKEIELYRINQESRKQKATDEWKEANDTYQCEKAKMEEKLGINLDKYGVDESTFEVIPFPSDDSQK